VFTDDIGASSDTEARDMRKGIIGIPCISSQGEFLGMALKNFAGIKQKRRRLVGDECFPAGTMIEAYGGPVAIEDVKPGWSVWCASGLGTVVATQCREVTELVKIKLQDGRRINCTPNHRFLTQYGWIKACELNQSQYIVSL